MNKSISTKKDFKALGRKAKRFVKRFITSRIPLRVEDNSVYTKEEILSPVITASVNCDFLEGCTKLSRALGECPTADDVFYHLHKLNSYSTIKSLNKALISSARFYFGRNIISSEVCCAIDVHDIPYYGDKNKSPVRGTKRKRGTNYAHAFMTLNIVEHGKRFTVAVLPYLPLDDKTELVKELIEIAQQIISIKLLFMDRDFPSVEMLLMLEELGIKYLMAMQKTKGVKKLLKRKRKFPIFTEYEMKSSKGTVKTTLLALKREENKKKIIYCFITNIKIKSIEDVLKLTELYRRRWGIETAYRVKKEFRGKTTSRKYVIRLLFFLISVLLYNIWILCNFLGVEEITHLRPHISAKHIKTVLFLIYFQELFAV